MMQAPTPRVTPSSTGLGSPGGAHPREVQPWRHVGPATLPHPRRRGGGAQHLQRPGVRAGASRWPARDQDRRAGSVAGGVRAAGGVHPADVRRDPDLRGRAPLRGGRATPEW